MAFMFSPADLHIVTSRQKSTPAQPLTVYNVSVRNVSLHAATMFGISGHVGTAQKPLIAARHVHAMEIPACVVDYGAPHLSQGSRVTGHKMVLVRGLDIVQMETC